VPFHATRLKSVSQDEEQYVRTCTIDTKGSFNYILENADSPHPTPYPPYTYALVHTRASALQHTAPLKWRGSSTDSLRTQTLNVCRYR
jgi:hypothetical protein